MAVNTLETGLIFLIVFKIIKVFSEVMAASVERIWAQPRSKGTKLRHIIFIIIESGMALFVSQLLRSALVIFDYIIIDINKMINVIIRSASFVLLITFTWLGHRTNNSFGAGQ